MKFSFWSWLWHWTWRALWRDLRSGPLRLVVLALVLAVAALTAVGFLADRLQSGLQQDARQMLGGDAVIASDNPTPEAFVTQAHSLGLSVVQTLTFPTMARASEAQGGVAKLVMLKAVEPGYPLRGSVRLAVQPAAAEPGGAAPTREIPGPGQAWVDASLLAALGQKTGDELLLGESTFRIAGVIVQEPDRGAGFMNFAPRVMIHRVDLAATGLIQAASRVNYRMAVAGQEAALQAFVPWAQTQIKQNIAQGMRGVRLETLQSGRPEVGQILERAEKFLSLVALMSALMSAIAVSLSARSFAAGHLDDCAMLRVLGLSQRAMTSAYTFEFILLGLFASSLGVLLGWCVHYGLVQLLSGLLDVSLPAPHMRVALMGLGVGLSLLLAFALPPVLQLARVPALRVMRRDLGRLPVASWGALLLGLAGFTALLLSANSDKTMGLIALGGFVGAVLSFAALTWLVLRLLARVVNESAAPRWLVLASRQLTAQPALALVQVSALAAGLLALVLLILLRTDLIDSWRGATSADAPNRFVINIMEQQADAFQQALGRAGVRTFDWYPMIRGRLVAINGREVAPEQYEQERAKRLVDREFNLSYSAQKPEKNDIVAGQWIAEEAGVLSVEQGLAETLGLHLGDVLRFDVGGIPHEARISSVRKVDWGSMRANFFVMYPVSRLSHLPGTYLSAFKAPASAEFDKNLVRQFPNVTQVDLTQTLAQLQRVLQQVIVAVELLFSFTLASGLVVLLAALTATRQERAQAFAIMRALGATGRLLRQVQRAELMGVGVLAGLMASGAAGAVAWALAHYVFDFAWTPSWWLPVWGACAGALLALVVGWWGLRGVLRRPVVDTLRQEGG